MLSTLGSRDANPKCINVPDDREAVDSNPSYASSRASELRTITRDPRDND